MGTHHHGHHHHHPVNYNRAFAIGVTLNVLFVAIEAGVGWWSHSLALLADAGHNLNDVAGLLLAWMASWMARREPTARRTYGWRRATILASLASAILLLFAIGAIGWEAVQRLRTPGSINGLPVVIVAGVGVVINTLTALLFVGGQHDLNIKGAYLHMAADAAVSLGVVVAGLAIMGTGWLWLDPVISLAIALIILLGTWGLLRDSLNLAMDGVPNHIDPEQVREYLGGLDGVEEVHDLHIWAISTTEAILTAHLVMPEPPMDDGFLHDVSHQLHDRFEIEHMTLQIERGDRGACAGGGCR